MQDWRTKEGQNVAPEANELKGSPNIFPSKEGARQLYGLKEDENLVFESNIGGPPEKAYTLTEMFAKRLQEVVSTHDRVKVVLVIDPQTRKIVPNRLAVTAGPVKVRPQSSNP